MKEKKNYNLWIKIISIAIPTVVAILFGVKIDYDLPIFLPPIYAATNALTALLLIAALFAVKSGRIKLHENLMKTCIGLCLC